MATALKCPNPSCPYLFDPTSVPAGVVLACPRCGMRFTVGPQPGAAPPPSVAPPPDAPLPVAPPAPEPRQPPAEPHHPPKRGGLGALALPIIAGLFIVGTLVAGIYFLVTNRGGGGTDDQESPLRDLNLSFAPPAEPWGPDPDAEKKVAPIQFVYRRKDADAWIAVGGKNCGFHHPRSGDLLGGIQKPLEKLFENLREEDRPKDGWLGVDATQAVVWRAQSKDGSEMRAVGYATPYKGVAYWAVYWASAKDFDAYKPEFDAFRERCKLLGFRETWKSQDEPRTFDGEKAGYQLVDADGLWSRPKDAKPTDEDEHADLLLIGKEKGGPRDRPEATLLVYLLDPTGGDPLDTARKFVEQKRTAEVRRGDPKITPPFTDVGGDPAETTTKVVRIESRIREAANQDRFFVLSAMAAGGKVVAAHATCELKHRSQFESTMVQIVGSLRSK
jgi:hypothetical protein